MVRILSSRLRRQIETSNLRHLAFGEARIRADRTKKGTLAVSMLIAFLGFLIHRDSMGQQRRVRIKRKRRLAYLRRKNAARRVATVRPVSAKQQAQKESAPSE